MKRIIHIALFVFVSHLGAAQHTAVTSQYMFNNLVINPAFTGALDAFSVSVSHRSQWLGLNGAPETQNFSVHGPLKNENTGIGLLIYRDAIGVTKQNGVFAQYAYRVKINKSKLSFGISAGASFIKSSWDQLATVTTNDPSFSAPYTAVLPNGSFGVYFYNKVFFAGASMPFFISHKSLSMDGKQITYSYDNFNLHVQAGGFITVDKDFIIKPSILIKASQSKVPQADFNLICLLWNKVGLGISYRTEDALIFPAQFHLNDQFMLSYSYDMTLSTLKSHQSGSHEVLLRYMFLHKLNVVNPRYF